MYLQEIVVSDVYLSILQEPLRLLYDRMQVEALEDIVHVEAVRVHLLDEVRCRVAVITDF